MWKAVEINFESFEVAFFTLFTYLTFFWQEYGAGIHRYDIIIVQSTYA